MAIPNYDPYISLSGITVASPTALHGEHAFRSAANFNRIVNGLKQLVNDHAGSLGNIAYIKERWEDPAIVGEYEEFPSFYILPMYLEDKKTDDDRTFDTIPYIGDPLAMSTVPVTVMAYYKFNDIYQPLTDIRNYAWNFWDILSQDKLNYALPGGIQAMTPHLGWHIAGTTYVVLWWSLQMKIASIL